MLNAKLAKRMKLCESSLTPLVISGVLSPLISPRSRCLDHYRNINISQSIFGTKIWHKNLLSFNCADIIAAVCNNNISHFKSVSKSK